MKWYQMELYDHRYDSFRTLLTTDSEREVVQEFKEQCAITPHYESLTIIELDGVYSNRNQSKKMRDIVFHQGRLSAHKY